jgi:Cytochrome c7 and related cytochrome c
MGRLWMVLLSGCSTAAAIERDVKNPHGAPDQCTACHAAGPNPATPGPALPVVATCRSCHPTADMHPVGMAPQDVHVPGRWPLEDGKVTCATCHSEPAHGGPAAQLASPWHRDGPYERITDLCYTCHVSTEYTRSDPHHPQVARDNNDQTCAACHTAAPAPGAVAEAANLRFPTQHACKTCHEGDVHAGVVEHLGRRVDAATLTTPLPLTDGSRIACWTCHQVHGGDPPSVRAPSEQATAFHQRALSNEWAGLAGGALRWPGSSEEGHPPLLAAPAADGTLCRSCHAEGDR